VRGKNKETRPNDPGLSYGRPSARRVPNLAGGRPSNNAAGCWRFHRDRERAGDDRAINSEVARSHVADITMTAGKSPACLPGRLHSPRRWVADDPPMQATGRGCHNVLRDASWPPPPGSAHSAITVCVLPRRRRRDRAAAVHEPQPEDSASEPHIENFQSRRFRPRTGTLGRARHGDVACLRSWQRS
jgi:hypothetical protein